MNDCFRDVKESLQTATLFLPWEVDYCRPEFSIQFIDHNLRDQLLHAEREGQNNKQVNHTTPEKLNKRKTIKTGCMLGINQERLNAYMLT